MFKELIDEIEAYQEHYSNSDCCDVINDILTIIESHKPKSLDEPNQLGFWLVYGTFAKGYTFVDVCIPDGVAEAGLAVYLLGYTQGYFGVFGVSNFIERYNVTKWIKADPLEME